MSLGRSRGIARGWGPDAKNPATGELGFAQQRFWLLDQIEPGNPAYNLAAAIRFQGKLDVDALRRSLMDIFRRHDILRTSFPVVAGRPVQWAPPRRLPRIDPVDLRKVAESGRVDRRDDIIVREARRPFNLERGPLVRFTLIRVGSDEHLLVVIMHHIISDGWSLGVFFRELVDVYRELSAGHPSPYARAPTQYADFVRWQRQTIDQSALDRLTEHWCNRLEDIPTVLELPGDGARPPVQHFEGATVEFSLPEKVSRQVGEFARHQRVTPFIVLLAVFETLIYRYTNRRRFMVGSPIANRTAAKFDNVIGLFVNTLVMRAQIRGGPTFREFLSSTRDVALDAFEHQDLPFDRLVEALNPKRDRSRQPLVQLMFAFRSPESPPVRLPDVLVTLESIENRTAMFDLNLSIQSSPRISGAFEYDTALFKSLTIERMTGHFERLISAAITDADLALSALPMLTAVEEHQLLVEWNRTEGDFPRVTGVQELIETQAVNTPDRVAVIDADRETTYGALNTEANQLARQLMRLGVGPEIPVGLYLKRNSATAVAVLGILKAGGYYVPLDADLPAQRLAFMLADSAVQVVVTQTGLSHRLPSSVQAVVLDEQVDARQADPGNPRPAVDGDNLAYAIYTSGSTGMPKAVQVTHRSLLNVLWALREQLGSGKDGVLAVASLSFDIATVDLLLPLMSGGQVTVASDEEARNGQALAERLQASSPTLMQATPSTWQMLLAAGWSSAPGLTAICAGETLTPALLLRLRSSVYDVWNLYGPTETTIYASGGRQTTDSISIGRPISNTAIYILDPFLNPSPIGVHGELYIAGLGLARGYSNRPDLTAASFIPNPFSSVPGHRMYRTGDLARYTPDGQIEFLGRNDQQVKIRGFRVELGEVEGAMARYPRVHEAVAVVREDSVHGKHLIGYVVGRPGQPIDEVELRKHLRSVVPEYMVPSAFVVQESLPRTASGKIDRRALPPPEQVSRSATRISAIPSSTVEQRLASIWRELLGVHQLGLQDDFFDLGGHSLLATELIARIHEIFGIRIRVQQLFDQPTLGGLAEVLQAETRKR
jgi:amino acid adenylation domain-containing protein